jgi:predicted DsbA family dithiol-disulfide isomerase
MSALTCQSCGMPIDAEPYCTWCIGPDGKLQAFEERFERFIKWQARYHPAASRPELERKALAYMAAMPAWQDHPRIKLEFP